MGILAAKAFTVRITDHRTKQKIMGQLFLGQYMSLPITHIENSRLIRQQKQRQIEKDAICENSTLIHYNFNIGNKFMIIKTRLINKKHHSKVGMKYFQPGRP